MLLPRLSHCMSCGINSSFLSWQYSCETRWLCCYLVVCFVILIEPKGSSVPASCLEIHFCQRHTLYEQQPVWMRTVPLEKQSLTLILCKQKQFRITKVTSCLALCRQKQYSISWYFQGRCPFYLEPAIIICFTDGSKMTTMTSASYAVRGLFWLY